LPSFVQPAATRNASARPGGNTCCLAGSVPAAGPWIHSRRKTGGSHVEISNQARNADTVLGGSDRFAAIRAGLCRGRRWRSTFGQPATAAAGNRPAPARSSSKSKKKPTKQSSADDAAFRQGYRAAHATIYERNDYAAAIEQLKALGHDDNAGVANLIGYSYRKLGDYKLSQTWYERALKADPNHVLTWQYYGLWQIEQGNRDQASYHLSRIAAICGTGCDEYRSLAAALEKPPGTGLVY
jgi:tetratricopeptide (TPR) repeat protein